MKHLHPRNGIKEGCSILIYSAYCIFVLYRWQDRKFKDKPRKVPVRFRWQEHQKRDGSRTLFIPPSLKCQRESHASLVYVPIHFMTKQNCYRYRDHSCGISSIDINSIKPRQFFLAKLGVLHSKNQLNAKMTLISQNFCYQFLFYAVYCCA